MEGANAGPDDAGKNHVEASSSLGLSVRGYRPELIALSQPSQKACKSPQRSGQTGGGQEGWREVGRLYGEGSATGSCFSYSFGFMFCLCKALKGLRIELKPELSDVMKTKTGRRLVALSPPLEPSWNCGLRNSSTGQVLFTAASRSTAFSVPKSVGSFAALLLIARTRGWRWT